MKKMLLMATLVSVALASCVTDESIIDVAKKNSEIKFVAANYVPQTRAEHDGEGAFTNEDFSVWAWQDGTDVAHMNGVEVQADGTVTGTYYWPNYALDFAATSPAGDPRIKLVRNGGESTITFKFDGAYANTTTTNLMYADFVDKQSYDSDNHSGQSTVALTFRHVLAKLNVIVNQVIPSPLPSGISGYQVVVNSLSFDDMLCQGHLDVEEGTYDGANNNYLWTAAVTDPMVYADWAIISTDHNLTTPFNTDGNYFVMPQTIADASTLNITYTVTTTFSIGTTSTEKYTKSVKLKEITDGTSPITEWLTNKNVTYTINIVPAELNVIKFTAKEEEMGTIGGSHTP